MVETPFLHCVKLICVTRESQQLCQISAEEVNICFLNINSILNKTCDIEHFLQTENFSMMFLNESHITGSNCFRYVNQIRINGYREFNTPRSTNYLYLNRTGGLLAYSREAIPLQFHQLTSQHGKYDTQCFESQLMKIPKTDMFRPLQIINSYRRPASSRAHIETFIEQLEELLTIFNRSSSENGPTILVGDLNCGSPAET